jgi:hypothetical protein
MPLFLLQDCRVMSKVKDLGIELVEKAERCASRRTGEDNVQALHAKFKSDVVSYVQDYAWTVTPKLDKLLEKKGKTLQTILNNGALDPAEKQLLAGILDKEIQGLEKRRHTKARDRAAATNCLEGETMCRSWCRSGKLQEPRDLFYSLKKPGSNPPEYEKRSDKMAEIARDYHENLQGVGDMVDQRRRDKEIDDVLEYVQTSIPADEQGKLTRMVDREEVRTAIKDLPDGKAAGTDGLPHEFWKRLMNQHDENEKHERLSFDVLKLLTMLYNDIEQEGMVEGTGFSKGWMCPIYKKSDRTDIANYRPITVLNTDYKIFTRALTTRLTSAVPEIIHRDQAGFMKGRRIEDQTELIKLMISACEVEEVNGVIVCLDQEKAYDKISHDFLFRSLRKFGFSVHFVNTVQSLYSDAHTVVIINGEVSSPFRITRGVRQGDPLSCLLFNIAIESLATMLRESNLEGLRIRGDVERTIATLFADDTTVYLSEQDSFSDLQTVLQMWCRASRAKFNVQKTEIIPVGSSDYRAEVLDKRRLHAGQPEIPPQIHIAKDGEPIRVLGAFVGNNVNQVNVWTPILERADRALTRWDRTRPTLEGKRLIVGMVVGGYTQYLTRVQGMPKDVETLLTKKIRRFMSGGGNVPMVGLPILHGDIEDGGKKVLDVVARNQAIELMKVKSYLMIGAERPKWAKIADVLVSKNISAGCRVRDDLSCTNFLLQNWRVNKSTNNTMLPTCLHSMLKAADVFRVSFDPPALEVKLKRLMPVWHHLGFEGIWVHNNGQKEVCLRQNHGIATVGDLEALVTRVRHGDHKLSGKCKCDTCGQDRLAGCTNPHGCSSAATRLLDKLPPKWSPCLPGDDDLDLSEDMYGGGDVEDVEIFTFTSNLMVQGDLAKGFRVFTSPEKRHDAPVNRHGLSTGQCAVTQLCISGACDNSGDEDARAGAGGWSPADDTLSFSIRLPPVVRTTQAAEIVALVLALRGTQASDDIILTSSSKYLLSGLAKDLRRWEDLGWIGVQNKELLKIAVAELRKRSGKTIFRRATEGEEGPKEAHKRAKAAAKRHDWIDVDLNALDPPDVSGAKLKVMMQALLYKGILGSKVKQQRRGTIICLDMARRGVKEVSGFLPTDQKIWVSLRNRDISRQVRAYLWKCLHNAHRCRGYWMKIPGYEQRAACRVCDGDESMEHILTDCRASGQRTVWRLVQEIFAMKGIPVTAAPTFGQVLGCALVDFCDQKGKQLRGSSRLYRIVVSESAYLIWRLRCEWRIERGESRDKLHTESEIISRWLHMVNTRLKLDCLMANRSRYGRKAIKPDMVERTWNNVLHDERGLPENWVLDSGVLVGMRVERPPGRNR